MQRVRRSDRRLLLLTSVVVPLLWLGAILALAGRLPIAAARPPVFVSPPAGSYARLGVNLDPDELASPRLEETLARLEQDGFSRVRFTLPWDAIEPERGRFDWSQADALFASLARYPGIEPLVVLDRAPEWARPPEDVGNPLAPPQERRDYGAFAAAVARRYGAQVRYYQIWDEPNIAPHWGARPADPADYLGLLREGAVQVRAADPDAVILLAALAPTVEGGGANLSDLDYLDALYRLGAEDWFDVVAAQPYGFDDPPDAPAAADRLNFARAGLLRDVMARHGHGNAPLWAAAFGWNALPADWSGAPSPWGQVTEAQQAEYAAAALSPAADARFGPMFWATDCPPRPADDPWLGFALCDAAGNPRPVASALAAAQGSAVLPPGDHAVDHPGIAYGPGWRVTPLAADPGKTGDTLSFDFYGTGAALQVEGGPYWALYRVRVDGQPANALPRDRSGEAYLVLYDPLSETRLATVAEGLPLGVHRLELTAEGGWGQWALQGIRIYGEEGEARNLAGWALLGLALLGTAFWAALAWPEAPRRVSALLNFAASGPDALYWGLGAALLAALVFFRIAALDLMALAGLGLLFVIRTDAALPLIAFSIPFWPRPEALLGRQFSHFELLVWLAALALAARWAVDWLAGQRGMSAPSGLDWPVLAFLGAGLLATFAAERGDVAVREYRTVFLGGALLYLLATRVEPPPGRAFSPWPVLDGLVLGAVVVSAIGLWQAITGQGRIDVEGVWRVRALYGSPNNLALYLDRIVPLGVAVAAFGAAGPRRLAYGVAALIAALACLATFSKGAWLLGLPAGLATVLLGGAWRAGRRWPLAALGGLAALGLAAIALLARTPRMAGLFDLRSGTSFLRLRLWQSAWRMGLDHPVLGVGPDNFLYAYRTRYVLPDAWEELNLNHPHNVVLDLWTRLGLAGLIAGAWLLIATALRGWRLYRRGSDAVWPLALGLLGGLAAALAHGLIDNSLFLPDLMALLMLSAGLFQRLTLNATH